MMARAALACLIVLLAATSAPACPHDALLTNVSGSCVNLNAGGQYSSWNITAANSQMSVVFTFGDGMAVLLDYEGGDVFVQPDLDQSWQPEASDGMHIAWVLPRDPTSNLSSYMVKGERSTVLQLRRTPIGVTLEVAAAACELRAFEVRPHANVFGDRYEFDFDGGRQIAETQAAFYWGTTLRLVVERTVAKHYTYPDGFVLSMLWQGPHRGYDGTYPDVDHEFHIKGRSVLGNSLDNAITRRMIELQLKACRNDPADLGRIPCAVHPDGSLHPGSPSLGEYHVRRASKDTHTHAEMFLLTANIAMAENLWLHAAATKDWAWLKKQVGGLEAAMQWVEENTDRHGRVWSDVYYEDQVIKDGRVAQAQAFAARAFSLAAEIETKLNRTAQAAHYASVSRLISQAMVATLPDGYWNASAGRFVDWVDRLGQPHDHVHLLANVLPVAFGYANKAQTAAVRSLVQKYHTDFQRLPSFVAGDIASYSQSEIGVAGPYDLCAMGRVWVWDAAYWASQRNGTMLKWQLERIGAETRTSNFTMAERYDMDYVYYKDGKDYHGKEGYYEYPAAYSWVLHHDLLGVRPSLSADLELVPLLAETGSVTLNQPSIALRWVYDDAGGVFTITNLADEDRLVRVDLRGLRDDDLHGRWSWVEQAKDFVHGSHVRMGALDTVTFHRCN